MTKDYQPQLDRIEGKCDQILALVGGDSTTAPTEPPYLDPRMEPYLDKDLMYLFTFALSGEFHNTWPEWWSWDAYNYYNTCTPKQHYTGPVAPDGGGGVKTGFVLTKGNAVTNPLSAGVVYPFTFTIADGPRMTELFYGITGGSNSGASYTSALYTEAGAPVLDTAGVHESTRVIANSQQFVYQLGNGNYEWRIKPAETYPISCMLN